jgi:proton-coupled amino acid transporter
MCVPSAVHLCVGYCITDPEVLIINLGVTQFQQQFIFEASASTLLLTKKTMTNNGEDMLFPLAGGPTSYGTRGPASHLSTYTVGEDDGRLAEMAKEFGLARQRQPRLQIRERVPVPLSTLTGFVYERMLDPGFADVRMRQVYTHSRQGEDAEGERLMGRLPNWKEDGDEEEVDPHAHGMGGDLVSAILGIIKGMVGPAILYLPHGFSNAGWVVAIPILIMSTAMFLCSSECLLDSWRLESSRASEASGLLETGSKRRRIILSYPELAYRALGSTGEAAVKIGIALMQSGVCLTYLIFVPQNLKSSTFILFGVDIPASYFMIVMLVFQIPMSWIRDIRKLTITNLVANILILYGLITCLGFALSNAIKSDAGRAPLAEMSYKLSHLEPYNSGWFLFIGTSVSCWSVCFIPNARLHLILTGSRSRDDSRFYFSKVPSLC